MPGAGFLAVGVLLLMALVWARREVIQVALLAFLFHVVPHFVYHAAHPAERLSATDNFLSTGSLGFMGVLATICLIAVSRRPPAPAGAPHVGREVMA